MANLDNILSSLPQETQDALKVSKMEGEETARKSAEVAREKGLNLAVKEGDDVFLNVKALRAIVATSGLKALLGVTTADDYSKLIVGIGDIARAAEIFANDEV